MNDIKVFQVNDYEWWAGADLESIKAAYREHYQHGIDPDDPDDGFYHPREMTDQEMETKIITYEDVAGENECSSTFRHRLNELIALKVTFPCYFAGTEC